MAMSKKDYQALARAIHNTHTAAVPELVNASSFLTRYSNAIADILAADSPRFNRALFIEACETGSCKGMRK